MLELGRHGPPEHQALGRLLAGQAWAGLIVLGPLGALIAEGAEAAGFNAARIVRAPSAAAAAGVLRAEARPGDAVLLKASRGVHLEHVLRLFEETVNSGP
jgi:UDP-N-acetylmuramoyl-tripeptide--D-alanyl-D-alanine ligase